MRRQPDALELNGIETTRVGNDDIVDFVMAVTVGTDDIDQIAHLLRVLTSADGPDGS